MRIDEAEDQTERDFAVPEPREPGEAAEHYPYRWRAGCRPMELSVLVLARRGDSTPFVAGVARHALGQLCAESAG